MRNVLVSVGLGALVAILVVAAGFSAIAAVFPSLLVSAGALVGLGWWRSKQVEAALLPVGPMLQERKIDEARALIAKVRDEHGPWQLLLTGQLEAQLGMIDYLQLKFDDALPRLEAGKWRNGPALGCIGAIHWRQGRKDQAYQAFADAVAATPKDAMLTCVRATLLARDGKRDEALAAVAEGQKSLPDHKGLKELHQKLANKQKIDPKSFGEAWYQYFPEDLAKEMMVKGRRGPPPAGVPQVPQPRIGASRAPRR